LDRFRFLNAINCDDNFEILLLLKVVSMLALLDESNEGFFFSVLVSIVGFAGLVFLPFCVMVKSMTGYLIFVLLYHFHLEGYLASSVLFL
jgi:hypothetical protein